MINSGPAAARSEHAGLNRNGGQPQDQGLEQVDGAQRVSVRISLGPGQQVAVARVLVLAAVPPADVGGQPDAPQHRGGQQHVPAGGLAVASRGEQADQGDQGQADTPGRVDHAVPARPQGHGEGDGHHDQQRGRAGEKREAERTGPDAAGHRAGRTARIWSTPIRPFSKDSAPPARYRRQTRTCSGVRSVADRGQVLLEVVQPGPDGGGVVLAHGLDVGDLEPGRLDQPDGLPDRAHVHVRGDVGLDERPAARGAGRRGTSAG